MVLLPNIQHEDMMSLVQYMYTGQVFIHQDMLGRLLKTAQQLQVKGLIEQSGCSRSEESQVGGECENLRFSQIYCFLSDQQRPASTINKHIISITSPPLSLSTTHTSTLSISLLLLLLTTFSRQTYLSTNQDSQSTKLFVFLEQTWFLLTTESAERWFTVARW